MKKTISIVFSLVIVILGYIIGNLIFGFIGSIIGALLAASYAGFRLRQKNVVNSNSPLTKETKGLKIAKYVLLSLILIVIAIAGFYLISNN